MKRTKQIADRFREVVLNGKWVANTNYKDQLHDLDWIQATTKIEPFNTIAALTFHINYYIGGVLNVLEGGALEIKDKYSFDCPQMQSQGDWQLLKNSLWTNAEKYASLVERLPDEILDEVFVDKKYGNYLRNLEGMIEHAYYHLGQITLLKKMLN
ncbi:DUF1572 domain-containing protein [Aquimarina gracilis]|uniref:DUF1572 domain-containing protein n=1 Tax=Aquimarina gracilis TaxID=874422 RepID=A0ABU6A2H2_9FLAO|nr:DUF1572 domain-containing protein [Aquimarina gracilis]MEB3348328.1 DUF1572 domain-containing protein [Aquimarina gracilis]